MPNPVTMNTVVGDFTVDATPSGYTVKHTSTGKVVASVTSPFIGDTRTFLQRGVEAVSMVSLPQPTAPDAPLPPPDVVTLNEYQTAAAKTAIYPQGSLYPFLGLSGETGEVSELAKKCIRDEDGVWSDERRAKLKKELGDVLWYLAAIARDHGMSLQEIAQANIEKLYSRLTRDQIKGSGDNR
jgi:NTP pyrophosphatase (non-canonical NTP hydrolase)